MVPHHQGAVEMAVAGSGGMGGNRSGSMAATTMDMSADAEMLRKVPEPFDRAFIDVMIRYHESAVKTAKTVVTRAET